MQTFSILQVILVSLLLDSISALPYGCGGKVGVLKVTQGGYRGLIWTCSGINPGYRSLYQSGQNFLVAASDRHNAYECGNYCSGFYNNGVNAGVYYTNSTCQCWEFGDIDTGPAAATPKTNNATFLDFYETGSTYGPQPAVKWGLFTCPAGAYRNTVYQNGVAYQACYPLTIKPGQPALKTCPSSGTRWQSWVSENDFYKTTCYAKFAPLKISLNFSSPYTLVDIYDFAKHPSTAAPHKSTETGK